MRSIRLLGAVLLVLMTLSTLFACSKATVEYIPDGGSYTLAQLQDRAREYDLGPTAEISTADAPDARQERLSELRRQGEDAAAVADALTSGFPVGNPSVPVLVEGATVDGQAAWAVIEAWGEEGASLAHRRLWVLDRTTFDVVSSSSFR